VLACQQDHHNHEEAAGVQVRGDHVRRDFRDPRSRHARCVGERMAPAGACPGRVAGDHPRFCLDGSQQRIVLDAQSGTSDRFGATLCQAGLSFFKIAFRFAYDMLSI